jgi:hypothetical protein
VAEAIQKKEAADKDELKQPSDTPSPPVGSGGSRAKAIRQVKKKKIQKKSPVLVRRMLTRQARGRTRVLQ